MFPAEKTIPQIAAALEANRSVVLQAPPGSGKTTCVPPALLDAPFMRGKSILMLEPRRLAARMAAARIAASMGEKPGGTVGYHIRLDRCVSARTRLEILTEGLLSRRLAEDPGLEGAGLVVRERLMTHGDQKAVSIYKVEMNGEGSHADVVSRSVARDTSWQKFDAVLTGNAACSGHTECDAIIMDEGKILAVPGLEANNVDAALVHEAAIGKIAGDQLIKLMTLGLTEEEAVEQIINGFLK